jgi:hypothetical protein
MTAPLRNDLNDFLFASVAKDANGMHLTMLSTLARAGVDPWVEAADLAMLSREGATQRLIETLAGVPNGPSPGADTESAASRLIELLHAAPKPKIATVRAVTPRVETATMPNHRRVAIYSLLALALVLLGSWVLGSRDTATPAYTSEPSPP